MKTALRAVSQRLSGSPPASRAGVSRVANARSRFEELDEVRVPLVAARLGHDRDLALGLEPVDRRAEQSPRRSVELRGVVGRRVEQTARWPLMLPWSCVQPARVRRRMPARARARTRPGVELVKVLPTVCNPAVLGVGISADQRPEATRPPCQRRPPPALMHLASRRSPSRSRRARGSPRARRWSRCWRSGRRVSAPDSITTWAVSLRVSDLLSGGIWRLIWRQV